MSRPKKAIVDYFPHFCSNGKSIFIIESKFGNDGYTFWFKLLELLGNTENHFIDCNESYNWEFLLSKTRLNGDTVKAILDLLGEIDCIDKELWDKKVIRSQNFINNLHTVYSRREVNVVDKPELMRLLKAGNPLSGVSVDKNPQSKVKYSKVKYIKGNRNEKNSDKDINKRDGEY